MNVLWIVVGSIVFLAAAYKLYGGFLSKRVFKLDDERVTSASELNDGVDYVPAKKGMLLSQHFSAIAAAGPVNGPILAATMFGWLPAMLWVLLGSVFIGGVHDMGSLIASVRNKAKSITEVVRLNVSRRAWVLFMLFIWITLVYVIVAFTNLTAGSFVGEVVLENGEKVSGSAIASSSLMYLLLPIAMGLLMKYAKLKEGVALLIFLPLVGVAIWGGKYLPISLNLGDVVLEQKVWGVLIIGYCLLAAVSPLWLLLQPRGALGGYFLYIVLIVAAIGIAFGGYEIKYPAIITPSAGDGGYLTKLFPVLFITIACGACSGFHALVSSGTSSKQLRIESDATPVGYGAMLLEALVAVVSICCVMIVATGSPMLSKAPNFIYASGIGSFMQLIGVPVVFGISFGLMAFTTFVYDTLDVCTRLGRYILQELTGWQGTLGKVSATALTAIVPLAFTFVTMTDAKGAAIPAWKTYWNTFGASNQLLASLALVGITVWLMNTESKRSKLWLVSFVPAVFMYIVSMWSLCIDVYKGFVLKSVHISIPWVSLVLICLALLVGVETVYAIVKKGAAGVSAPAAPSA